MLRTATKPLARNLAVSARAPPHARAHCPVVDTGTLHRRLDRAAACAPEVWSPRGMQRKKGGGV